MKLFSSLTARLVINAAQTHKNTQTQTLCRPETTKKTLPVLNSL